jgi:hypothetical protein
MADAHVAGGDVLLSVHQLVMVRLTGATQREVDAIAAQIGLRPATAVAEPDLVIRFVDQLPGSGPVRLIGLHDAGFTDDAFLVLGDGSASGPRVQMPVHRIGGATGAEIVCEHGRLHIPMLDTIVNLLAQQRGALPIHGAAFSIGGTGVLTCGWSKAGKTESLLAFLDRGGSYVGDETVFLTGDGRLLGVPRPIRLWRWHLDQTTQHWASLDRAQRARLRALRSLQRAPMPARVGDRLRPGLDRRQYVDVRPEQLGPVGSMSAWFDRLFFLISDDQPGVSVGEADTDEIARRMAWSMAFERQDLDEWYAKFRFAFPDAVNPALDGLRERQEAALIEAFAGRPAYVVRHPYPVEIDALYEVMAPLC